MLPKRAAEAQVYTQEDGSSWAKSLKDTISTNKSWVLWLMPVVSPTKEV
jgi:hypothetical protein